MARGPTGRRSTSLFALALLAGLSLSLSGCGDPGGRDFPPGWRGRDLTEPGWANGTLEAGWAIGLEYVWPAGKEVEWDWLVEGPGFLHFQVMRMEDGQGETIRQTSANESRDGLTVVRSGAHQLLWRNEGSLDVRFWYRVPEGHGGPRLHSPTQGPDCTFLLARLDSVC